MNNPTLDKESFARWLAKQPDDREFDYRDVRGCLFCAFAREELGIQNPIAAGDRISHDNGWPIVHMPSAFNRAAVVSAVRGIEMHVTIAAFKAELAKQLHKV